MKQERSVHRTEDFIFVEEKLPGLVNRGKGNRNPNYHVAFIGDF